MVQKPIQPMHQFFLHFLADLAIGRSLGFQRLIGP